MSGDALVEIVWRQPGHSGPNSGDFKRAVRRFVRIWLRCRAGGSLASRREAVKMRLCVLGVLGVLAVSSSAHAQLPVRANPDQARLLASRDGRLAANKRLVYDFWREVFEAGHMDLAERYMAETYIQHNPNVPTGRAAFVAFFTQHVKPRPVQPRIAAPLVTIVAEGGRVILSFVR